MPDLRISDLTALTAPAADDYLPIVDISETVALANKRITIGELFRSIPVGTVAAPSIAIEGDDNTGIYFPATDAIGIVTAGVERIRFYSSGTIIIKGAGTAGSTGAFVVNAAAPVNSLVIDASGNIGRYQTAPAAIDVSATLTNANIKTGILTSTTAAPVTMTMPLGTTLETLFFTTPSANQAFDFYIINTGATNDVTVAGNTGVTTVGSMTVGPNVSGHFILRRTAANTQVVYRLS